MALGRKTVLSESPDFWKNSIVTGNAEPESTIDGQLPLAPFIAFAEAHGATRRG
jgi:hypothetical protein